MNNPGLIPRRPLRREKECDGKTKKTGKVGRKRERDAGKR